MSVKSLKHFLVLSLSLVFFVTFLTSCGGGGGSATSSTTTINGQATLGPLSGASIVLTDLNGRVIATTTAKSDNSNLSIAGSFSFSVKNSELPNVFLLKACGGIDIDPSDNSTAGNGITNNGCIHAILTADDLYGGKIEINPLTEMIYQDALNTYGANLSSVSESDLKAFLNKEAQLYLNNSGVTYSDILAFNPIKDKSESKISWDKILSLLVFSIHKGEDFGTLNQKIMVLKSYLKKNGVYISDDGKIIEQIKDNSKNERFITSITESNDNSSIGTFRQVLITNSGEIIDIYVSKINNVESYLSATIKKQGHTLSIEGKTTLLKGLSFNKNTIANFVEPLIQITSDNSSSIQIKIDKRLVEKISNHEVVLKIDGMKPSFGELQISKDDPELKWEIEKTNEKSTHILFGSVGLNNNKNIKVDIMKDGSIVLEMPIYVYDTEILKQDLQSNGDEIINGCLNLIVDGASLALESLCSSTGVGAIACAPAAIISAYSLVSDAKYLIHVGSNFYKSHTISSAFGILEYNDKNKLVPGQPYTPIFFIRHDSDYGEEMDIHMNGYYVNGNSYGIPESLNLDYGRYYFKPHTGYIIVPSRKFYILDSLEHTNFTSNLFQLNNTNSPSSSTPYTPFITVGVGGDGIKFVSYTSFKIDLNNQKIYTNFTYSIKNNRLYLDASSSIAPNGSIESYIWKNSAGETIATGETDSVSFSDLVVKDGLASITLETRSGNYTGERTKVISLCGQGEIYENGACVNLPGSTILSEDFSHGFSNWTLFGSPSPKIVDSFKDYSYVFDNNGDSWCDSGIFSKKSFNLQPGLEIDADMYFEVDNYNGCFNTIRVALTNGVPQTSGNCVGESYYYYNLFIFNMEGEACWADSSSLYGHSYIQLPPDYNRILGDKYVNGWHHLKIVINNDYTETVYIDGTKIGTSSSPIPEKYRNNVMLMLAGRSLGYGGKNYMDNVVVKVAK